jgi:hypothetical protein
MWDTHEKESFPSLCAQVAFENAPAPGFYDTGAEQQTTREVARVFRPTTLEELEGGKRRKARRPAPGPHGSLYHAELVTRRAVCHPARGHAHAARAGCHRRSCARMGC